MPVNKFPTFSDYQSALQHPGTALNTNFLRNGIIESDLWGFPRVRSGGFALTYKITLDNITWALRCFHRGVRDRGSRYAQISQVLENINLPFLVPSRYFHHGILVNNKPYPMSILKWIEGESLESYILHHLEEPDTLDILANRFREVCNQLEYSGIAHGDLSHRNILIKSGEIFLIDYDGMFVPALSNRKSCELGNIHFQHPSRTSQFFNKYLDRFPSIVIFLAIKALATEPSLWQEFQSGGEGLLFQQNDFINPNQSKLLERLELSSLISQYIQQFRQICQTSFESIPSLEEFINSRNHKVGIKTGIPSSKKIKSQNQPVFDAWSVDLLRGTDGQLTTVVGIISEVFHGVSKTGENHIFVNFGDWQKGCFTAVLWGQVLEDLDRYDTQIDAWIGRWMSVTGLITVINNRPQIQVESITDLLPLATEENAKTLLQSAAREGRYKKIVYISPGLDLLPDKNGLNLYESKINKKVKTHTEKVGISEIFTKSRNPLIETTLNLLYAKEHFKGGKT